LPVRRSIARIADMSLAFANRYVLPPATTSGAVPAHWILIVRTVSGQLLPNSPALR